MAKNGEEERGIFPELATMQMMQWSLWCLVAQSKGPRCWRVAVVETTESDKAYEPV